MTKTLTEQWKDGELPSSDDEHLWLSYYIMFKNGSIHSDSYWSGQWGTSDRTYIKEVLAPVPSYDEFVQQRDFVKDHQKVLIENMNLKLKIERLKKQLARTKTKEYIVKVDWFSPDPVGFLSEKQTQKMFGNWKKKKEVK